MGRVTSDGAAQFRPLWPGSMAMTSPASGSGMATRANAAEGKDPNFHCIAGRFISTPVSPVLTLLSGQKVPPMMRTAATQTMARLRGRSSAGDLFSRAGPLLRFDLLRTIGSPRALHKFPPDDPGALLQQLAVASIDGMPAPCALSFDNITLPVPALMGASGGRCPTRSVGWAGTLAGDLGGLRLAAPN